MRIIPTTISGVMVIEIDPHIDERGLFARTFCADTFANNGLASTFPHCNTSWNRKQGTLRGLHYQVDPQPEAKLVRATRGRVFDVTVDLRPNSESYLKWAGIELDARKRNALYIPPGCAHGFLTLEDDCELFYQMSENYVPELARTIRWDDPTIGIEWPFTPQFISLRDRNSDYLISIHTNSITGSPVE